MRPQKRFTVMRPWGVGLRLRTTVKDGPGWVRGALLIAQNGKDGSQVPGMFPIRKRFAIDSNRCNYLRGALRH